MRAHAATPLVATFRDPITLTIHSSSPREDRCVAYVTAGTGCSQLQGQEGYTTEGHAWCRSPRARLRNDAAAGHRNPFVRPVTTSQTRSFPLFLPARSQM
ncbi:hypothetical protein MRX96_014922 [Rhipicephalus microplus]